MEAEEYTDRTQHCILWQATFPYSPPCTAARITSERKVPQSKKRGNIKGFWVFQSPFFIIIWSLMRVALWQTGGAADGRWWVEWCCNGYQLQGRTHERSAYERERESERERERVKFLTRVFWYFISNVWVDGASIVPPVHIEHSLRSWISLYKCSSFSASYSPLAFHYPC